MPVTLRGTKTPLLQEYGEQWSPSNGFARNFNYRGFDEASMRAQMAVFINAGVEAELSCGLGVWSLRAVDTTGAVTIDKWEVNIDEEHPSCLQNPRNSAYLDLVEHDKRKFKKGLREELEWDEVYSEMFDTANGAVLGRLYQRIIDGSTQYQKCTMVLRHTTNAPARYQSNIADIGVNQLYSHADLLSECLSGSLWVFPLPGALQYAITYFYNTYDPPSRSNYFWSWLKSGSPRVTVANNRVDIATQFKLDQWSTDEYATY